MIRRLSIICLLLCGISPGQTSADNPRLKAALPPAGGARHVYKKAGATELPLYVHAPANHPPDAKAPAIVFFFGGGWSSGSPAQFEQQCKYLAGRGHGFFNYGAHSGKYYDLTLAETDRFLVDLGWLKQK